MNKKIVIPIFALMVLMSACGKQETDDESLVFGDIDTSKEYIDTSYQAPSAVERKDAININDYFMKIPFEITQEVISSELPTISGDKYPIDRIQLNDVYFDINQIANQNNYKFGIANGIAQVIIPREGNNPVVASVAQIADASMIDKEMDSDQFEELAEIIDRYKEIYENTENQSTNEYGNYYTYADYVDWLNEHEDIKFDIGIYSPEQVLQLAIDTFNIDKTIEDFYINKNADLLECSDWYSVKMSFRYEKEGENTIEISVKKSPNGVFLFMTQYMPGDNINAEGNIYYTPTMIINIAQNNYYQIGENYTIYNSRQNYNN